METGDWHASVQLEEKSVSKAFWHHRKLQGVCRSALRAGVAVGFCVLVQDGLFHLFVPQERTMLHGELAVTDQSNVSNLVNVIQSSLGKDMHAPHSRPSFHPSGQHVSAFLPWPRVAALLAPRDATVLPAPRWNQQRYIPVPFAYNGEQELQLGAYKHLSAKLDQESSHLEISEYQAARKREAAAAVRAAQTRVAARAAARAAGKTFVIPQIDGSGDGDLLTSPKDPFATLAGSDDSAFVRLFGQTLQGKERTMSTAAALSETKTVAIYFSAKWCGPCRLFTPLLEKMYHAQKSNGLEVVYASMDDSESDFKMYYEKMPWLTVPFIEKDVRKTLGRTALGFRVTNLPTLVILNAEGKVLDRDGVSKLKSDPESAKFPWKA